MSKYEKLTFSPEETFEVAYRLGKLLQGGEFVALEGDLGAGKTHFVKGLAKGLDIKDIVTSPTFTLLNIYEGRLLLAHFDVYRLPCPEALEELGYEEYFYGPGVTAVEWSDRIAPYLPQDCLQMEIRRQYSADKGEARLITIRPSGPKAEALVEELKKE